MEISLRLSPQQLDHVTPVLEEIIHEIVEERQKGKTNKSGHTASAQVTTSYTHQNKFPSDVTCRACVGNHAVLSALCSQMKTWTEAVRDGQWTNTESTERSNVLSCFNESSSIKGMIVPLNRDHLLSFLRKCTNCGWPHDVRVSLSPRHHV